MNGFKQAIQLMVGFILVALLTLSLQAQSASEPQALLQRAIDALGIHRTQGKVLHYQTVDSEEQPHQSDRTYPPYFSGKQIRELWYNPTSGLERCNSRRIWPGTGPNAMTKTMSNERSMFVVRDTGLVPTPWFVGSDRRLNAMAVLWDWAHTREIQYIGRARYRDYMRDVLQRKTAFGIERLYLDVKTSFPAKLEYEIPQYLYGQVLIEYVYSNWTQVQNTFVPSASFRLMDGEMLTSRTSGSTDFVSPDSLPKYLPPAVEWKNPEQYLTNIVSEPPETVAVGHNTFLIKNAFYTETVSLLDNTVYIFDATLGEQRAKQDEAWIEKLFPGKHQIVVVVTDLAWPHIAGVRYWVSRGATIVSHRMSEAFLRKVIERKWTLNPDELQKKRREARLKFVAVDTVYTFAKGKVQLYPIDGIGSEGALMAYLPEDKYLWAGDYIQQVNKPTAYATEVWRAVKRVGIRPERVAAEHIPVILWKTIEGLQGQENQ